MCVVISWEIKRFVALFLRDRTLKEKKIPHLRIKKKKIARSYVAK